MNKEKMFSRYLVFLLVLIAGAFFLIFTNVKEQRARDRNALLRQLSLVRAEIQGILNERAMVARGLSALIEQNPQLNDAQYQMYCRTLIGDDPFIRNLTLVKGSVIEYVFPEEGNAAAIGTDLLTVPGQSGTFITARETGKPVLAGPLELVQGGIGLILRIPLFTDEIYWGQLSIVFNMNTLYEHIQSMAGRSGYKYQFALQKLSGVEPEGEYFYGSPSTGPLISESMPVSLPGGGWIVHGQTPKSMHNFSLSLLLTVFFCTAGIIFYVLLILKLNTAHENLKKLAYLDPLTGLLNRRLLDLYFHESTALAERSEKSFSLLVLDVNDFKIINDTWGHETGDICLVKSAEVLKRSLRATDRIFRTGGDEFLVFLNGMKNNGEVKRVMEKIRGELDSLKFDDDDQIKIRVSMGCSHYPDDGKLLKQLMHVADSLMYEDKQSQRNLKKSW